MLIYMHPTLLYLAAKDSIPNFKGAQKETESGTQYFIVDEQESEKSSVTGKA